MKTQASFSIYTRKVWSFFSIETHSGSYLGTCSISILDAAFLILKKKVLFFLDLLILCCIFRKLSHADVVFNNFWTLSMICRLSHVSFIYKNYTNLYLYSNSSRDFLQLYRQVKLAKIQILFNKIRFSPIGIKTNLTYSLLSNEFELSLLMSLNFN